MSLIEEEVGDDYSQHPDVLLGKVEVAERLVVRGKYPLASPSGCRSAFVFLSRAIY